MNKARASFGVCKVNSGKDIIVFGNGWKNIKTGGRPDNFTMERYNIILNKWKTIEFRYRENGSLKIYESFALISIGSIPDISDQLLLFANPSFTTRDHDADKYPCDLFEIDV